MQIDETFNKITAFIKKTQGYLEREIAAQRREENLDGEIDVRRDASFKQIIAFVTQQKEELRAGLRLAQPGNATLGLSFEPDMALDYVPLSVVQAPGIYATEDASLCVEVLRYDVATDFVYVEVISECDQLTRFDFFSGRMFARLFHPVAPGSEHEASFKAGR